MITNAKWKRKNMFMKFNQTNIDKTIHSINTFFDPLDFAHKNLGLDLI